MWNIFKIVNFIWLMGSTYMWITTYIPLTPLLILVNIALPICVTMLPIKIEINKTIGRVLAAIVALTIWSIWCEGPVMGLFTFMCYFPALYLIILPREYQADLLNFVTKWYAIMLGIGLVEYFLTFVMSLPNIGMFSFTGYQPYTNYGFYIKTTYDSGFINRFNAFFLEPGHQALVSTFLLMANKFKFKENRYCIVLALGVVFSFSLAGYLLAAVGFILLRVDNIKKLLLVAGAGTAFVVAALTLNGGDNDLNNLIISRLEYDEQKGIKGNNRFTIDTDLTYKRGQKSGESWFGLRHRTNMKIIDGAGFKIYVIKFGWIGVILAALFYLAVIPSGANRRYTVIFLTILVLCFIQRSYPTWYSWIFPYVVGIYLQRKANPDQNDNQSDVAKIESATC